MNYKRKKQKWKNVTDSEGYDGCRIPASFDSAKHRIRQQQRLDAKEKFEMSELNKLETIDDFINFYEAIPEEKWCTQAFIDCAGCACALGHLPGFDLKFNSILWDKTVEQLYDLVNSSETDIYPQYVNDGEVPKYNQETPKQRVLAFLKDCKNNA